MLALSVASSFLSKRRAKSELARFLLRTSARLLFTVPPYPLAAHTPRQSPYVVTALREDLTTRHSPALLSP